MRKIIFILFLTCNFAVAQDSASLMKLDSSWEIDPRTKIGSTARIPATDQNPFPYCFATAATMLYDQTICSIDGGKRCNKPQTSFLAIAAVGQGNLDILSPTRGGSPIKSLDYLVTKGAVNHSDCNYDIILKDAGTYKLTYELQTLYDKHKKYSAKAPYLSRYFKYEFKKTVQQINPSASNTIVDELLSQPFNLEKFTAKILLTNKCSQYRERDPKLEIKFTKVDSRELKQAQLQIDKILRQKKPIIVSFCITVGNSPGCNNQTLHSLIVIAQAKAIHKITGDKRTVYWLVNSWGEGWQEKNSDGWVYADKLLEAAIGELIWLELKQ